MTTEFGPSLIAISDVKTYGSARTIECMEALMQGAKMGSVCVQLRDAQLDGLEKLALGKALLTRAERAGQWLSINDRLDIAALLKVPAIHLGEHSVSTRDARQFMRDQGQTVAVSRACHDPSRLSGLDANAAIVSPALAPRKGLCALGADGLSRAVRAANLRAAPLQPCRVFALGGIDAGGLETLRQSGITGVAVQAVSYGKPEEVQQLLAGWGIAR